MASTNKFAARVTALKTAVAAKKATVKKAAPAPAPAPVARRRVTVQAQHAPNTINAALHTDEPIVGKVAVSQKEWDAEDQVEVFVKRAFKFTTDDHVLHDIPEGTQTVPKSWHEHAYFQAHEVEATQPRKVAK